MTDLRTRSAVELVSAPEARAIAYITSILPPGRPRRLSRMSYPGETKSQRNKKTGKWEEVLRGKYEDEPRDKEPQLTREMLIAHVRGERTYACTIDYKNRSCFGVIEIDAGGRSAVLRTLDVTQSRGLMAHATALNSGDHDGGHVVIVFDDFYPEQHIVALLESIARESGLVTIDDEGNEILPEIWPRNQGIRLPFGTHQLVSSRGDGLTQDGQVFHLDNADDLVAWIDYVISHPRNSAPREIEPDGPLFNAPMSDSSTRVEPPSALPVPIQPVEPRRISPGEAAAERLRRIPKSTTAIREINLTNDLVSYLTAKGGSVARHGRNILMHCPCGRHSHNDKNPSLEIRTSHDGIQCAVGSAPNCVFYHGQKYKWDYCAVYKELEGCANYNEVVERHTTRTIPPRPAQSPHEMPEYLTPAAVEARRKDKERKRQAREQERLQRLAWIDELTAELANDSRLGERERCAWLIHCHFFGTGGQHCVSVAQMAAKLREKEIATEADIRSMQRATARLIEYGYLIREDRRDGTNTQTSWWKPNNPDAHRVTRDADNVMSNVTLIKHETHGSLESLGACDPPRRGSQPDPDGEGDLPDEAFAAFDCFEPDLDFDERYFDLPEMAPVPGLPDLLDNTVFDSGHQEASRVEVLPDEPGDEVPAASYNPANDWTHPDNLLHTTGHTTLYTGTSVNTENIWAGLRIVWAHYRRGMPEPQACEQVEQAVLTDASAVVPAIVVESKPAQRKKAKKRDAYRAKIATFSDKELRGELRYKENTLRKCQREGKPTTWVKDHIFAITEAIAAYEDALALDEPRVDAGLPQEVAPVEQDAPDTPARSHAHPAAPEPQAGIDTPSAPIRIVAIRPSMKRAVAALA